MWIPSLAADMEQVYVYDAIRTPRGRGRVGGALQEIRPFRLLSGLLVALQQRAPQLDLRLVSDVLVGCVSPYSDQGYNIAQAAVQDAQWPLHIGAVTSNRYCASGLETVHQAAARIAAGFDQMLVAGGVECMSRVPLGSGGGALLRDPELMLAQAVVPQGVAADLLATLHEYTRETLDAYALQSQQRAFAARQHPEAAPTMIAITDGNGIVLLDHDELPRLDTSAEALAALRPAFAKTAQLGFNDLALSQYPQIETICHVHTAGNSSGLADGAAVVLLGSAAAGKEAGLSPRARIVSLAISSSEPTLMLTGMIPATALALQKAELSISDIDLFEVNEAFAAVPLAFCDHFQVAQDRVNVCGGAIALGHPVGATGAILLGTLIDELHRRELRRGLVTLCAGGGQGIACVVETM